jgi:hypothetical protein
MANDDRVARMIQAIDAISDHCKLHGNGILQSCLDGLARKPEWTPEEIALVRALVEKQLGTAAEGQ